MQRLGDITLNAAAKLQARTGIQMAVIDIDVEPTAVASHRADADIRILAHESEPEVGHEVKPADRKSVIH
jgi:hypothetical protein